MLCINFELIPIKFGFFMNFEVAMKHAVLSHLACIVGQAVHVHVLIVICVICTCTCTSFLLVAVRIDWRTFIVNPQDDKIIDLVTHIGHPFPLQNSKGEQGGGEDACTPPLVRAHIFPHEGSPTSDINLIPNQLVSLFVCYMYMCND